MRAGLSWRFLENARIKEHTLSTEASNLNDETRAAAHIVERLLTKGCIGGAHYQETHLRHSLREPSLRYAYRRAVRLLRAQGWLIFHAKGRPGKDDQVSLNPATVHMALAWALPRLSEDRRARVQAFLHFTESVAAGEGEA